MRKIIAASVLIAAMSVPAFAKRDPDVDKALKREYPDAQTQITNTREINGVKVNDVKVTTKNGESFAQVTEYGDFVSYGVPREHSGPFMDVMKRNVEGLFKSAPQNVDMYRVTNYIVDLSGANGKTYRARFDAVGRLKDLNSSREVQQEDQAETAEKASGGDADNAKNFAKKIFPDAKVEDVYKSNLGDNFYNVKTADGFITVNSTGQVYGFREKIDKGELPKPVMDAVNSMFNADKITNVARGEWEYYQFDEQTPTGEAVVVRMRPNGDILKVISPGEQEEQSMTAAHHQKGDNTTATPHVKKKKAGE